MAVGITVAFQQSGAISEVVKVGQLAESLGYEGLWLNDAQSHWRDVYVSLGALAANTSRLLLGTGVTNIMTRHLSVTASAIYSLDELSGGRARMGIGIGAAAVEDIGAKPTKLADLASAVGQIRELWAGRDVDVAGARCHLQYAAAKPRTIPVYLAASAPQTSRLAGEIADGLLCNVGADLGQIVQSLSWLQEGVRSAGRDVKNARLAARVPTCISDDPQARRYVRARVGVAALRRDPAEFDEEDARTLEKIRQAYDAREHLRLDAAYAAQVTDRLVDKFALAGRPEECLERVRALMASGIDELNVVLIYPDTAQLLRIFAERVLAKL